MRTITLFPQWSSDDINDVIFENRNKLYGAYDLRKHYNERLRNALLITLSLCCLLCISSVYFHRQVIENFSIPQSPADTTIIYKIPHVIPEAPASASQPPSSSHQKKILPAIAIDSLVANPDKADSTTVANPSDRDGLTIRSAPLDGTSPGPAASVKTGTETGSILHDDSVIILPKVFPLFPGGQKALSRYIQNHMHPPKLSGKGTVYLSFIISKEGVVTNVQIVKDNVGFGYGEEAARVLRSMPKWTPGLNNDRPVNVKMMIPISFETKE